MVDVLITHALVATRTEAEDTGAGFVAKDAWNDGHVILAPAMSLIGNPTGSEANASFITVTALGLGLVAAADADTAKAYLDLSSGDTPLFAGVQEGVYTITDGAAFDIDPSNGGIQLITLGASRTPVASNFLEGQSVLLGIADGTAYAITWSTVGVVWIGGSAPALATSGKTWVELWKVGSTIYGAHIGDSAS